MKVLAVDPGMTTGYVVLSETGEPIEWGNLSFEDVISGESILDVYSSREDLHAVFERVPIPTQSRLDQNLLSLMGYLDQKFPRAQWISPSTWKSLSPIFNLSLPKAVISDKSLHLRDAYRIGMWYLLFGCSKEEHDKK